MACANEDLDFDRMLPHCGTVFGHESILITFHYFVTHAGILVTLQLLRDGENM